MRIAFRYISDTQRFRWIAVHWGNRIRHLLDSADLIWFDAYASWVNKQGSHPGQFCAKEEVAMLDRPTSEYFWARRFAEAIHLDNPLVAACYAGASAADDGFRYTPDEVFEECKIRSSIIRKEFCDEFRDVAGNPFQPIVVNPLWQTEAVLAIAQSIDREGAFGQLPIVADALQEAGCDDERVLSHCQSSGPHVPGCWLINMLLQRCD